MTAGHLRPRQVKVTPNPDSIRQQPREPITAGQRDFLQLGTLKDRRRVEIAPVESHRERHVQPGQIKTPGDSCIAEIDTPRIDLILELTATPADESSIDNSAHTISNLSAAKRAYELSLIHQRSSPHRRSHATETSTVMTHPAQWFITKPDRANALRPVSIETVGFDDIKI